MSRFFNQRYLPKLGLKTDKKSFHSIRHSVIDHLKQKGIDVSYINDLVGHHSGNIDLDSWGVIAVSHLVTARCMRIRSRNLSHNHVVAPVMTPLISIFKPRASYDSSHITRHRVQIPEYTSTQVTFTRYIPD